MGGVGAERGAVLVIFFLGKKLIVETWFFLEIQL